MALHSFNPVSRGKLWSDAETIARIVSDTGSQYEEQVRARLEGYNAASLEWKRLAVNADGELVVNLEAGTITIGLVDQGTGGSSAWKVDGSAVTQPVSLAASVSVQQATAASLNAQVVGVAAHAAAASGNPVRVGAKVDTNPASLAEDIATDLITDDRGNLRVKLFTGQSTTPGIAATTDGISAAAIGLHVNAFAYMYNGATLDRIRGDTTNGLDVDVTRMAALVAGSATIGAVNQTTGQGKTLLFGVITQAGAGTTALVSASAANKVKLVSYVVVLDAAGSVKFTDGTEIGRASCRERV